MYQTNPFLQGNYESDAFNISQLIICTAILLYIFYMSMCAKNIIVTIIIKSMEDLAPGPPSQNVLSNVEMGQRIELENVINQDHNMVVRIVLECSHRKNIVINIIVQVRMQFCKEGFVYI